MDEKKLIQNLSAISHEIQTPINLIASTANLINYKADKNLTDNDELREYMENIVNNCNKISMMISNIMDLNMLTISKKEYVNTKQFFETFCKNVEPFCNDADVEFKSEFKCEKEFILIPVATTERILLNLITNAIKYNDKKKKKLSLKMYINENNLVFSVKDNGIGIEEENIEKVTEQFFRANQNLPKGFGLGLTLVKEYIAQLDGNLTIKSQLKKGTEIIVSIPFKEHIYVSGESNYIYNPEKTVFNIEFAQLKTLINRKF